VQNEAQGRKQQGNLGPGTLYPGVGKVVQRTGRAQYCGSMSGLVFGYVQHPNSKDARRTSTRFLGQFLLVTYEGGILQGAEAYFPGTYERTVKAALDMRQGHGEPIQVSFDVTCEPDQEGRPASPLGWSYGTYDRTPQQSNDPLLSLAYAAGILERPATMGQGGQLTAPDTAEGEQVDPETGEVTSPAAVAA
jgi:hypothetical protein